MANIDSNENLQDPDPDVETDEFLVEIECLTSKVLRGTRLWNLQIHQARGYEENDDTVGDDGDYNDDIATTKYEIDHNKEMSVSTA